MTPSLGIEPRPHWWVASALTAAPSLLASNHCYCERILECHVNVCVCKIEFKVIKSWEENLEFKIIQFVYLGARKEEPVFH